MKRVVIAVLVAAGTLVSAVSCATTDGSSQGGTSTSNNAQDKSNPFHYPAY
jgi:predicted small secreted protein